MPFYREKHDKNDGSSRPSCICTHSTHRHVGYAFHNYLPGGCWERCRYDVCETIKISRQLSGFMGWIHLLYLWYAINGSTTQTLNPSGATLYPNWVYVWQGSRFGTCGLSLSFYGTNTAQRPPSLRGASAPFAMVTWKWQIVSFLVGQNGCARLPLLLSGWYIHLKTVGNMPIFTPCLMCMWCFKLL